jgi:hypothetical protein
VLAGDGARPWDPPCRGPEDGHDRLLHRPQRHHPPPRRAPRRLGLPGPRLPHHRRPLLPQRRVGRLRRRLRLRPRLGPLRRPRAQGRVPPPLGTRRRPPLVPRWPPHRRLRGRQGQVLRPRIRVSRNRRCSSCPSTSISFEGFSGREKNQRRLPFCGMVVIGIRMRTYQPFNDYNWDWPLPGDLAV